MRAGARSWHRLRGPGRRGCGHHINSGWRVARSRLDEGQSHSEVRAMLHADGSARDPGISEGAMLHADGSARGHTEGDVLQTDGSARGQRKGDVLQTDGSALRRAAAAILPVVLAAA